ncbi:MAG: phosphatidylglycerophosphatase A [bacterium]|nr:phosphatidylglycerophosphatase A [bacterium]
MNTAYFIATVGKSGLAKKAPGTIGSMVSLLFWAPILMLGTPEYLRFFLACCVFFIGIWVIPKAKPKFVGEDNQAIVIDEAAGIGFTLSFCPPLWINVILGFILFRIFDILKPWPVSFADKKIKGPFGIMLDDFLAGIYAMIILYLINLWIL